MELISLSVQIASVSSILGGSDAALLTALLAVCSLPVLSAWGLARVQAVLRR